MVKYQIMWIQLSADLQIPILFPNQTKKKDKLFHNRRHKKTWNYMEYRERKWKNLKMEESKLAESL
jgi:hypothetical protein